MTRPLLKIDVEYRNTNNWRHPDDVFNRMFKQFPDGKGINNVAGFRTKRKLNTKGTYPHAFCILVTNLNEVAWPDNLDLETGIFTYYGDNRNPGTNLLDQPGNTILADVYGMLHGGKRMEVPPFLCFEIVKKKPGSYMKFLGLAVPGAAGMSAMEDLVGVWRIENNTRFENYKSIFNNS